MPVLQIRQLSKFYKTLCVLENITLELEQGESFGLIGLNGAGKTTLLKSLLDLHQIQSGEILLSGIQHTEKQARHQLVYLPEKFNPPDFMSGMEYLHYILAAYELKIDSGVWDEKINSYCQKLDFEISALNKPVTSYSKGMQQKLGLIGVLLSNKEIIVLDEPMSGLDPKARFLFKNLMHEFHLAKKTVLFCTHILNDIEVLCDRIGILHNGKLRFVGTAEECCIKFQAGNFEQAFLNCVAK